MKRMPQIVWKINRRQKWVTFFYSQPVTCKRVKVRVRSYDIAGLRLVCKATGVNWEVFNRSLFFGSLLSQYIPIVTLLRFNHAENPYSLIYIIYNIFHIIVVKQVIYDLFVTLQRGTPWTY